MATATRPVSQPRSRKRHWTTPGLLWRSLWALWICDGLLLASLVYAGRVHSSTLKTIGIDSAPSIIAAQQIKSSLADMNADAIDGLLAEPGAAGASMQAFNEQRQQVATALIAAAQNITFGDAERLPILQIQLSLGRYEALIQQARDQRAQHNPAFVATYNEAADLLDSKILTAADALDSANLGELERTYKAQRYSSGNARNLLVGTSAAMLLVLALVQSFLLERTHRIINIPLFLASILLLSYSSYAVYDVHSASNNLKRAKEDAFTSIHALWRARAVAYEAKSDQRRLLLDPKNAAQRTTDFTRHRDEVAKLAGQTYDQVANATDTPAGLSGYLADELNNITFPGEGNAAMETLRDFARYVVLDGQIRTLESQGKHRDAIALCTGTAPGQSDWAFDRFSDALQRTLKINQDAFDGSVKAGFGLLRNFDAKAALVAAALALLCLLGVLQRTREYS